MDASHQHNLDPHLRRVAKDPVPAIVEVANAEAANSKNHSWRFSMGANALLYPLLLIALAAYSSMAMALNNSIVDRICIGNAVVMPPLGKRIPIPVGCELIDCCPGCPGPGPVEWRMKVDSKVLEGAELRFEGMSAIELRKLKIRGKAKLDGDRIILRRGDSRISGVPDKSAGKVTVGSLVPIMSKDAAARLPLLLSRSKVRRGNPDSGNVRDDITVEQFLGSFRVNSSRWRHVITPCIDRRVRIQGLEDRLKVQSIAGGDNVVVMMDARTNFGAAGCRDGRDGNDWVLRSNGDSGLGNLLASAGCNSEIAVFSTNNAMLLETPVSTWTNNPGDLHTVTLHPIINVPVSVWIASSAAAAQARDEMANANLLFEQNKVGVQFHATYQHVWSNQQAVEKIKQGIGFAENGDYECKDVRGVQESAFYTANRLNVYYVDVAITGRNCAIKQTPANCPASIAENPAGDGNITYIGTEANLVILAHEFGHAFGLRPGPCGGHTNGLPGFGSNNIMWVGGLPTQNHFSLGQVFRMNTHTDDWGGTMLIQNGLRPKADGRACLPDFTDNKCPALHTDWDRP